MSLDIWVIVKPGYINVPGYIHGVRFKPLMFFVGIYLSSVK